jgi:hypothetical protein
MNNLLITRSKFVFYSFALLAFILAIFCSYLLPKKYFSDALTIINNPWNLKGYIGSFQFSILFYSITCMRWLPYPVVAMIQYPILIYILLKICVPPNFDKIRINNVLMYFSFFILGIYLSMQSKDFITFLFCALLIKIIKRKHHIIRNRILICILLILFSLVFRTYYFIVLILSILFSILHKLKINNIYALMLYGLLFIIIISLTYGVFKDGYMSDKNRTELNEARFDDPNIKQESKSAIVPPFPTNTWYGEAISILYGFVVVNIPINSFLSFSPQVIMFSIWQLTLFINLFIKFKNKLKAKNQENNYNWAFYITFTFFIVQGLFEPDLGSSIRHKAGIFPLIYFILFYDVKK